MLPTRRRVRRGMTIIEVMFAIVILSGVMLAMSRFGQSFTRAARNAANLAVASDLATARIEAIRGHTVYATLVSTYDAAVETAADTTANPSMTGHAGYTRTTRVVQTSNASIDYTAVTVTVTADVLAQPVTKTAIIAAFR
ncbi:MAG: Tfp pilus assembly protein FimT/FimU [Gemmatimonadaceae bacterium]